MKNHLGKDIVLEDLVDSELQFPPARNQESWDKLHLDYVIQVGKIVGFKHPLQTKAKLTRPEKKVFENIFEEYHHQSKVQEIFGSYGHFFQSFFVQPYGVKYSTGNYEDFLPEKENELEQKRKNHGVEDDVNEKRELELRINQLKEEIGIIKFTRGINLPTLLSDCLDFYEKNSLHYQFKEDLEISYTTENGEEIKTFLHPEFSNDLWDNLFNGCFGKELTKEEDCLFITIKEDQERKKSAMFQKYWFASLLHSLNPKIHYLNFVPPAGSNNVPSPLLRVKFMEAEDINGGKTLIVGGVMGADLDSIKSKNYENTAEYVDEQIRSFFSELYPLKDNFKKRTSLVYNFSHPKGKSTSNQFNEYIKKRYSANNFLESMFGVSKTTSKKKLTVKSNEAVVNRISNLNLEVVGEEINQYWGEQYSETFGFRNQNVLPGAFTDLDGKVLGLEIAKKEIDQENKALARRYSKTAKIISGLVGLSAFAVMALSVGNFAVMKYEHFSRTEEYSFIRLLESPEREQEATKRAIIDRNYPLAKGRNLKLTMKECITQTDLLFKSICGKGGIDDLQVTCIQGFSEAIHGPFFDRPEPQDDGVEMELLKFHYDDVKSVQGIVIGAPKSPFIYVPGIRENKYYSDGKPGIEVKLRGKDKPILIYPTFPGKNNQVRSLLNVMQTYLNLKEGKTEKIIPGNQEFINEVKDLSKNFRKYQFQKKVYEVQNEDDYDDYEAIAVYASQNDGQVDYRIAIGKKSCYLWQKLETLKGMCDAKEDGDDQNNCQARWNQNLEVCQNTLEFDKQEGKDKSLSEEDCLERLNRSYVVGCDGRTFEEIFSINTANLTYIKARDREGGVLEIETEIPLTKKAYPIPYEKAKRFEELLSPFVGRK